MVNSADTVPSTPFGGNSSAFVTCRLGSQRCRIARHNVPQTWTCGQPIRPPKALRTSAWAAFPEPPWSPGTPAWGTPGAWELARPPASTQADSASTALGAQVPWPGLPPPGLRCARRAEPGRSSCRRAPSPARLSPLLPEPQPHPAVITTL